MLGKAEIAPISRRRYRIAVGFPAMSEGVGSDRTPHPGFSLATQFVLNAPECATPPLRKHVLRKLLS